MASVDDLDELIATRKLNGVNDNLYKEDSNIEDVEKLKSLQYEGRLTQYGKRKLIKYYENKIAKQKQINEDQQKINGELRKKVYKLESEIAGQVYWESTPVNPHHQRHPRPQHGA